MTIQPKISIIIPLYNVEEYIFECLQSVARQTYKGKIECIIVNDCGTDNSVKLVEQFIADYSGTIVFLLLHHEHNRGLSAARNTGVAAATGEYIYFLDSDDYISDDCIEVLVQPLQERMYDMVMGNLETFGNPCSICFLPDGKSSIMGNEAIFHEMYVDRMIYVMAWNKLLRTSLFHKHDLSFLEGQLHEDELWSYKVMTHIQSLAIQYDCTYHYRIRKNSIMETYDENADFRLRSCYDTLSYVLFHPWNTNLADYEKCLVYYFGVYLRNTRNYKGSFYHAYVSARKTFDYPIWHKLFTGQITLGEFKHQLHFALPPLVAYFYLRVRNWKQNTINGK